MRIGAAFQGCLGKLMNRVQVFKKGKMRISAVFQGCLGKLDQEGEEGDWNLFNDSVLFVQGCANLPATNDRRMVRANARSTKTNAMRCET